MSHDTFDVWDDSRPVTSTASAPVGSRVHQISVPPIPETDMNWTPYQLFRGATPSMHHLTCHASVLAANHSPHEPHEHEDEELLILLDGEIELILPDHRSDLHKHLRPGGLVFYPAHFRHTLRAVGTGTATYLMFKWVGAAAARNNSLQHCQFDLGTYLPDSAAHGFQWNELFEGSTQYLRRLHCHVSSLAPGCGYDPHVDPYDVAILTLYGDVETLGQAVPPRSVVFYPAGEPHGMRNNGLTVAVYVVFEFEGDSTPSA